VGAVLGLSVALNAYLFAGSYSKPQMLAMQQDIDTTTTFDSSNYVDAT